VSEQNPTFDAPPPPAQPPAPPAQPPAPPAQAAPLPPLAPPPQPPSQATFGTAPTGFEQVGAAPGVDQTIGTAPPPKKSPLRALLLSIGGVVLLIVVALAGLALLNRNSAANAKVGDCLPAAATDNSSDDASTLKTVACTSAEAESKVVGIVEGLNRAEFDAAENPCTQYATAESALWIGKTGSDGTTFCLEPVRPS